MDNNSVDKLNANNENMLITNISNNKTIQDNPFLEHKDELNVINNDMLKQFSNLNELEESMKK